jgi:hypothetical protein
MSRTRKSGTKKATRGRSKTKATRGKSKTQEYYDLEEEIQEEENEDVNKKQKKNLINSVAGAAVGTAANEIGNALLKKRGGSLESVGRKTILETSAKIIRGGTNRKVTTLKDLEDDNIAIIASVGIAVLVIALIFEYSKK